ncbi:hypothetical protein [Streptomyces sp. SID337]|uniref:hypothetical protein n=2 Tax=Streptomyces TaxID=1883 RepID=UPI0013684315|nr:hypothetical protein [Streptomyces sp. SID337]MYZ16548.1 hypothetical protein [Streptomyces sp. SID337]
MAADAPVEQQPSMPPMPDQPPTPIKPGRGKRAKAAFAVQCGHATARTKDWLAAGDLDQVDLIQAATEKKRRKHSEELAQQQRIVAEAHGRLAHAKMRTEIDGAQPVSAATLAHLGGRVAAEESKLAGMEAMPVMPPTDREIDDFRHGKQAGRAAVLAAGGFGSLSVLGAAIEQAATGQPVILAALGTAAGYGWYLISRPFVAHSPQEASAPFLPAPASLPATLMAGPAGGAAPIVGGNVVMSVEQLPEDLKPFPIRGARTPEQLAQCVLLAARAEGVPIVEVSDVQRQPWGWQCIVRVSEGTPEAIIAKSGALETRFDLQTNGVKPQPIRARRACAVMRFVEGDPFATAPGLPYRAPKSLSITDRFRIGTSVGGDPLEVSLAGVMGLWVAASGGGKTGILQALAEGTTACYDNITIDCDPHGDGLEDLGDAVRITARSNEQIEAVLLFFLVMSKSRARLRAKLGMGKKWKPSATHPAVTIFIDEFPKLSDLAKLLAFELLLVGRKELIEVQYASQGGTTRYLGENIAQMMALKAVGPCKVGDTRAVFGDDSVREGYLPHKLSPATDTDPKDAGHIFIQGVPGMADEPIEYAIHEAPSAVLRQLATERLEAGLLDPDQDSLDGMQAVDLPEYVEATYDNDGNIKKQAPVDLLSWDQLLRLCDAQPAAGSELDEVLALIGDAVEVMDRRGVDRMRTEVLAAALGEHDPDTHGSLDGEGLKVALAEAVGKPVQLGAWDGMANPRGYRREDLALQLRP